MPTYNAQNGGIYLPKEVEYDTVRLATARVGPVCLYILYMFFIIRQLIREQSTLPWRCAFEVQHLPPLCLS